MPRKKADPDDKLRDNLAYHGWPECVTCEVPALLGVPMAIEGLNESEPVMVGVCADCFRESKAEQGANWKMEDHWLELKDFDFGGDA